MNNFFLSLSPTPQKATISYNSKLVSLGSCFVDNIGQKLNYYKLQNTVNPFGIIFHPEAINTLIKRVVLQKKYTENDLFFHNEQWQCFEVHSQFSNVDKKVLLHKLNSIVEHTHTKIRAASHFILTFGTAWGYQKNNQIVANCHKVPQKEFQKKLSTVTEIQESISETCKLLLELNPSLHIITTVSPVRHIKDGIIENNRSKAHLLAGLHETCHQYNQVYYYPVYELVIDCLRDYRFYKSDLIHPNETAINYIWEHFVDTWLHDSETKVTMNQIAEIQRSILHRPFNPESDAHQKFLKSLEKKKETLIKKHSFIEF